MSALGDAQDKPCGTTITHGIGSGGALDRQRRQAALGSCDAERVGWGRRAGKSAAEGPRQTFGGPHTKTLQVRVQSQVSWPCGPGFRPTPECHRRRIVRHEAGGMGY